MTQDTPQPTRKAKNLAGKRFEISKSGNFEAAHRIARPDPDHPYNRVHGHSFTLTACVAGRVKEGERWVEDFSAVSDAIGRVVALLDHRFLNEIEGLETPTLEDIAVWCAERLKADLPNLSKVTLARPSLNETCTYFVD